MKHLQIQNFKYNIIQNQTALFYEIWHYNYYFTYVYSNKNVFFLSKSNV